MDEDVEMELGDIATAAFGNDKASEVSGAEDEDNNSKGDIGPCIAMLVHDMNNSADEATNDESEMVRANDGGNEVADEPIEHDSEDGHAGSQQKRHYRKQNPSKLCASTLFWTLSFSGMACFRGLHIKAISRYHPRERRAR